MAADSGIPSRPFSASAGLKTTFEFDPKMLDEFPVQGGGDGRSFRGKSRPCQGCIVFLNAVLLAWAENGPSSRNSRTAAATGASGANDCLFERGPSDAAQRDFSRG